MFNDCNYSFYISIWLLLNQWTKLPLGSSSSGTLQGCHSLVQCLTNPSGSDWSPWSISLWSARCQAVCKFDMHFQKEQPCRIITFTMLNRWPICGSRSSKVPTNYSQKNACPYVWNSTVSTFGKIFIVIYLGK